MLNVRFFQIGTVILALLWFVNIPTMAYGQVPTGTIAYVRSSDQSGDQIRLIKPDGSNDREIWKVPEPDPLGIFEILSLDWSPDATELAFSSDHEHACSIYASDLYSIRPDGSRLRRVSNGPLCDGLTSYPQGSVQVTIRNFTSKFDTVFFVYVQGAPEIISVTIPYNGVATVTFPEVADFGAGTQSVAVLQQAYRWYVGTVNVQPGQTTIATPNPAPAFGDGILEFGAWGPTWRSDGSRIGYARSGGSCLSVYSVPAKNTPIGTLGDPVLTSDDIAPCHMAWAPTLALADQVIFAAYPNLGMDGATFYQATEGDTASNGKKLFSIGATNLLLWYDWAPDGKSLLFVHTTKFANTSFVESNLFEYNLATGQITQVSNLSDEFVRSFSVSPNGDLVVFERAATLDSATSDLWIMNRDGSNLHLLVKNGRAPNWSLQEPTSATTGATKAKIALSPRCPGVAGWGAMWATIFPLCGTGRIKRIGCTVCVVFADHLVMRRASIGDGSIVSCHRMLELPPNKVSLLPCVLLAAHKQKPAADRIDRQRVEGINRFN